MINWCKGCFVDVLSSTFVHCGQDGEVWQLNQADILVGLISFPQSELIVHSNSQTKSQLCVFYKTIFTCDFCFKSNHNTDKALQDLPVPSDLVSFHFLLLVFFIILLQKLFFIILFHNQKFITCSCVCDQRQSRLFYIF